MKNLFKKHRLHLVSVILLAGISIINLSCNDDDDSDSAAVVKYGVAIVSGSGEEFTTYIKGVSELTATIDNNKSAQLPKSAALFSDGTGLYTAGFGAPATLEKYVFNKMGDAVVDQVIISPGANTFSTAEFLTDTKAYATVGGGISRIVQFDPSTMRITGEVDLSDAGENIFYSDMIVREGKLFVALNDFNPEGNAQIAVVDITTNTMEKVISDPRTSVLFGSATTSAMAQDSNGDIYVLGTGFVGFAGKPSGVLRIKKGQTEFDPSYFFDLSAVVGGKSCYGLYHIDGITFTSVCEDDSNFFGFDGTNPVFRYRKINLSAKTDGGELSATLPNTFAGSRTMFFVKTTDDEILFPIAGTDEDALYSYTISTGAVSKKTTSTTGYITGLAKLF